MTDHLTRNRLSAALQQAGKVHHEYEMVYLQGQHDPVWAGWYAAYVLGRLGDFTTPSRLTRWLEEVTEAEDWSFEAADLVWEKLHPG